MNRAAMLLVGSLLFAAPAVAQTPVADLYVGYSVLNDDEIDETFTKGFVASLAFSIGDTVAIPLEFSWHSKDLEVFDEDVASLSVTTYMAGFRFGRRFYIQVLAGGATAKGEAGAVSADTTEFALQPGFGFDLPIGNTLAIRLGGDYRRIFSDPGVNEYRGHIGLVFYLGHR
jgi:outer membrane protein with beta-barrel domain